MATITGGCLCGAVRYRAEADAPSATVCHCRDCQKFTGSAFAALVLVPKNRVTIEGTLKTFSSIGGSGKPILRHFCPEYGSSIAEEPGTRPGMIILTVGTFDEPEAASPAREIFRDDALAWVSVAGDIPRFAKRPG
ncbi:MAG TPA: GFA family protein [Stellaceae bacterium]|nr:GFA family protein [Stellaceae bacterium]